MPDLSRFSRRTRPYSVALPAKPIEPNTRLRLVVDQPQEVLSRAQEGKTSSSGLLAGEAGLTAEVGGASGLSADSGAFRREPTRPAIFSRLTKPVGESSEASAQEATTESSGSVSFGQTSCRLSEDQARQQRGELGPEERQDEELVALACAGQSTAFEALYRRHSAYVMALGVRVQGNPTDIEDIVHDAFLRAHDRLDTLRAGGSFRPWLASVVVSLVRSRLRRRRMLTVLGLSTAEPIDLDSLVTPDAGPEVRAQIAQVYRVLERVPVDQRICWTLRYVEGRKLEDVAEIANCSLATAKRRIAAVQQEILLLEATQTEDAPRSTRRGDEPATGGDFPSARLVEAAATAEKSSVKGSSGRDQFSLPAEDGLSQKSGERYE